jgi:hypothetical protein
MRHNPADATLECLLNRYKVRIIFSRFFHVLRASTGDGGQRACTRSTDQVGTVMRMSRVSDLHLGNFTESMTERIHWVEEDISGTATDDR